MPVPLESLQAICKEIEIVQQGDEAFNTQQQTFINHIEKLSAQLLSVMEPIPQSQYALERILPTLDEVYLQQLNALIRYAKLLLESPESFGGASLNATQEKHICRVYDLGRNLANLANEIIQKIQIERRDRRSMGNSLYDLQDFLMNEEPVLSYFLRDRPVVLAVVPVSVKVSASYYHVAHMVQHLVTTLAHELIEYGQIKITVDETPAKGILDIFCTGITLNSHEMNVLFQYQGRYMYMRRFQRGGASIKFQRDPGRGASIQLHFPKAII